MNQLMMAAAIASQTWVPSFLIDDVVLSYALGWALIHSVWQGLLIVGCTGLLLNVLRQVAPHTRYVVACGGLFVSAMVPVVTFVVLFQQMLSQSPAWTQGKEVRFGLVSWARSTASVESEIQSAGLQAEQSQIAELSKSVVSSRESKSISPVTAVRQWDLLLRFAVWGWTGGVFFCCVRLLGGLYKVHLWRKSCYPLAESSIICLVAELRRRMHISTEVGLLESVRIATPVAIGWFKPVILLPVELATGLNDKELEAILAHELAHIRRHDYLVNVFQSIIEVALFYHPAVWWLSREIRRERENCCDDEAIAVTGNRLAFARALTHLEGLRNAQNSVVMAASGGLLSTRIHRIMQMELKHPKAGGFGGLCWRVGASILMVCLGVSVSYAFFVQQVGKVDDGEETSLSVVDTKAQEVKTSEELASAHRSEQAGVRLIVSHTYATARRESKGWVEVDGVQVPVDVGILHDGVIVYLTLMNDVVAADIAEPKAIWSLKRGKSEPIWDVVSIVEVYVGEGRRELGVELFASKFAKQGASYRYVSLKTGEELKPVRSSVEEIPTDSSKKNGAMFEVDATQATYRLTRDGWSHVTGSNVILRADLSDSNTAIVNQFSRNLELRAENARVVNGAVEAETMRWNIPAGCKLQLELRGVEVIFSQSSERAQAQIVSGEVEVVVDDQRKAKLRNSTGNGRFRLDWRQTEGGYEMQIAVDRSPGAAASSGASLQLSLEMPVQQSFIMEPGAMVLRYPVGDVPSVQPRTAKKEAQAGVQIPSLSPVSSSDLTDELLRSIEEMGDWNDSDKRSPFQSWSYMLIANRLLETSEPERIKIMRELGARGLEGPLVVLCRMLLESRDSNPLRGPKFGTPLLLPGDYREGENSQLPLAFIRDTPFLVVREYRFDGERETALHFFEDTLIKGRWRTKRYDTSDEAIDAVSSEILRSQLWGDRVDADEWNSIGILLTQLRPSAMIRIASLKHVTEEKPVYVMEDEGGSIEEIVARLCQRVPENERPTFVVLLHIDEDVKYEWVIRLLDTIRTKGFSSIRTSLWQRRTDEMRECD